jgi:hypothetical protein
MTEIHCLRKGNCHKYIHFILYIISNPHQKQQKTVPQRDIIISYMYIYMYTGVKLEGEVGLNFSQDCPTSPFFSLQGDWESPS